MIMHDADLRDLLRAHRWHLWLVDGDMGDAISYWITREGRKLEVHEAQLLRMLRAQPEAEPATPEDIAAQDPDPGTAGWVKRP